MRNKMKFFTPMAVALVLALLSLVACTSNEEPTYTPALAETPVTPDAPSPTDPTPDAGDANDSAPTDIPEDATAATRTIITPQGDSIVLPAEIQSIVTLGPSVAEILVELGFAAYITATDSFSAGIPGLGADVPRSFGIMDPDPEYLLNLMPDVVFIAGASRDPLAPLEAAGIPVIYIATANTIGDIYNDIRFIANIMDVGQAGADLVAHMEYTIDTIRELTPGGEGPTVYFEVSPAPWMFSFGNGTFLNEMLEILNAQNIFAGEEGWIPVTDEAVILANPDIILTSTDFLEDPIQEILDRPGFDAVNAVVYGRVHQVDADASSRPSQNILDALWEMAVFIHPDIFS